MRRQQTVRLITDVEKIDFLSPGRAAGLTPALRIHAMLPKAWTMGHQRHHVTVTLQIHFASNQPVPVPIKRIFQTWLTVKDQVLIITTLGFTVFLIWQQHGLHFSPYRTATWVADRWHRQSRRGTEVSIDSILYAPCQPHIQYRPAAGKQRCGEMFNTSSL